MRCIKCPENRILCLCAQVVILHVHSSRTYCPLAIENYDGAGMTRLVIWIKHTLGRDESYLNELRARPDAMNHYISYLREMKEFDELSDLLGILNRPEEEAFLDYQRKLEQSRPGKIRADKLKVTKIF